MVTLKIKIGWKDNLKKKVVVVVFIFIFFWNKSIHDVSEDLISLIPLIPDISNFILDYIWLKVGDYIQTKGGDGIVLPISHPKKRTPSVNHMDHDKKKHRKQNSLPDLLSRVVKRKGWETVLLSSSETSSETRVLLDCYITTKQQENLSRKRKFQPRKKNNSCIFIMILILCINQCLYTA